MGVPVPSPEFCATQGEPWDLDWTANDTTVPTNNMRKRFIRAPGRNDEEVSLDADKIGRTTRPNNYHFEVITERKTGETVDAVLG
jgi:hypothetical protein